MEMKKEELDEILENHVKWLNEEGGKRANLREADLEGANLSGDTLHRADLGKANLVKASLRGTNLMGANLVRADLETADLREADLRGANLTGTNLRDACLRDVNLRGADLRGADLRGAKLFGADLRGANLGSADLRGALLPSGVYQIVGAGSHNRCTTYDGINNLVICGCWNDGAGNHLDSFVKRIEEIYGAEGEEPNLEYHKEYMAAIAFFKAMKELRERYLKEGKDDGQNT